MVRRQPVLLLTATITPPSDAPRIARTDPAQRLQDYRRALEFYRQRCGSTFSRIVFADNSGSDLSVLQQDSRDHPVEFLSTVQDHPAEYGRAYGEMRLIEYALQHSSSIGADDTVWKCTGRYRLLNVDRLVARRPDVDLYVHCRNRPYPLCEMFSLAFNRRGSDAVFEAAKAERVRQTDAPYSSEVGFRKLIDEAPVSKRQRFTDTPVIDGIRAYDNTAFNTGVSLKLLVRRVANVVAPWYWI